MRICDVKRGNWVFREKNLTIQHVNADYYDIDVEDFTSSAQVLDWIFQISKKLWCNKKDIGDFVCLLNDIFYMPQGVFCPFGKNMDRIDVKAALEDAFRHIDPPRRTRYRSHGES